MYSTTGLQAELDKGQGGVLWGTIIVPSLQNGVDTTVESNMKEIVKQLSKRATSLSELFQSLEMIVTSFFGNGEPPISNSDLGFQMLNFSRS